MATVICKVCNKFVRTIPPPKSNMVTKGFCYFHLMEFRKQMQQSIYQVQHLEDILERCLVSWIASPRPNPHSSLIDELSMRHLRRKKEP